MLDSYWFSLVYLGEMRKTPLTKENKNQWFEYFCFTGKPIVHKHHIVPKHHGGEDTPENIIEVDIREHAQLHKKIWEETGCKTCYKDYKSLMGVYKTWLYKSKMYGGKNNEVDWYRYENQKDVLKDYQPYESGLYENTEFDQPDEHLMSESINQSIAGILETLSDRERIILEMSFGLGEWKGMNSPRGGKGYHMSLDQIGEEFDLTRDRIGQIREKAIQRLRHRSRSTTLRRYL